MSNPPFGGFLIDIIQLPDEFVPQEEEEDCKYCSGYTGREKLAIIQLREAVDTFLKRDEAPEGLPEDFYEALKNFYSTLGNALDKLMTDFASMHEKCDENDKKIAKLEQELRTVNQRCDSLELIIESEGIRCFHCGGPAIHVNDCPPEKKELEAWAAHRGANGDEIIYFHNNPNCSIGIATCCDIDWPIGTKCVECGQEVRPEEEKEPC